MQDKLSQLEKKYGVDWREFEIGELFTKRTMKGFPKSAENLEENSSGFHIFGQNIKYQYPQRVLIDEKYLHYVDENKPILAYTSSAGELGMITENFYRSGDNGAFQGLFFKYPDYNKNHMLYLWGALSRIFNEFGYSTGMADVLNLKIQLPVQNSEIAFEYIDEFVETLEAERLATLEAERLATLEAYLKATGLNNVALSAEECASLDKLGGTGSVEWTFVKFDELFNHIQQGKRLKKSDQLDGAIPFVMAGTTNTGIVKYISNPVRSFPKNSLTIDIFGNTFYRDYAFGAGDDTGVFWNDNDKFDKYQMLFLTAMINKALAGKYDFGHKLRASQTTDFEISLPVSADGTVDLELMTTFITAMQKVVIKGVVEWADKRIEVAKGVIENG